ncbi:hypothetical protein LNKW23_42140 [Paralimibaculum aggregatum]|uniref:Phosphotransferase n=1 Tax=Paralimibaculum aggregatum TaxID=3036245 RepID=A0ABQ6LSE7_9RHOB|nr:hypothetical protein [Limibaculum sp. NKW23]GMG84998.1 hypothetical protein LNKW23_42140 [Limibaculum sp. NKW23]
MTLDAALSRMPHRGPMLLIARVLEADPERILAEATDHRAPDHPLRRRGRLMTAALAEIGAQAAAAHASLHGIGGAHIGMLLALRDLAIGVPEADAIAAPLRAEARRIAVDGIGARYRFTLEPPGGGPAVLAGEALLSIRGLE